MAQVAAAAEALVPLTSESEVFLVKSDQWPTYDSYEPLDLASEEIRLLKLRADEGNDEIVCTLHHAKLTDKPNYSALSYYWGAPVAASALKPIRVGGTTVKIRPALHSFLSSLISRFHQLAVWLDVICINQEDIKERGSQVSLMGKIFSSAQNVYAWLGDSDADSDYVFDGANGLTTNPRILSECLEQLFWRPYWTRMWVIQEFSLAQNITLLCGDRVTQWEQLEQQAATLHVRKKTEGWNRFEKFTTTRTSDHSNDHHGDKTLFTLMEDFQRARCMDSRDKVYALLSLSSDGKPVSPDYSISAADLFFRLLSLNPPLFNAPLCGNRSDNVSARGREPWEVSSRIRACVDLEESDLLASCRSVNKDRLYTWLEYVGTVASVQHLSVNQQYAESPNLAQLAFPCEVRDQTDKHRVFRSSSKVKPGDEIFRLSLVFDPPFYIVLDPSESQVSDVIVRALDIENKNRVGRWDNSAMSLNDFDLLRRVFLKGMKRCRTTLQRRCTFYDDSEREVVLMHITRLVFCVLQPLTYRTRVSVAPFLGVEDEIINTSPLCSCRVNGKLGSHKEGTSSSDASRHNPWACHTTVESEEALTPMGLTSPTLDPRSW